MNKKPRDFTPMADGQMTDDTELYSQYLGGGAPVDDYKGTLSQLLAYMKSKGLLFVHSAEYGSDALAAAGGVAVGEGYQLSATNVYGIPVGDGGIVKIRKS